MTSPTARRSTGTPALEIAWTAIPFVLVTAVAIVSAIVLSKNSARRHRTRCKITVDRPAVRVDVQVPERPDLPDPSAAAQAERRS